MYFNLWYYVCTVNAWMKALLHAEQHHCRPWDLKDYEHMHLFRIVSGNRYDKLVHTTSTLNAGMPRGSILLICLPWIRRTENTVNIMTSTIVPPIDPWLLEIDWTTARRSSISKFSREKGWCRTNETWTNVVIIV